jgi:hypothetical protein
MASGANGALHSVDAARQKRELDAVKQQLAQMQAVLVQHSILSAPSSADADADAEDAAGGSGARPPFDGAPPDSPVALDPAAAADASHHLRRPIIYSCLFCRERHQKCDGAQPCSRCRMYGKQCIFVERKRHKWGKTKQREERRKASEAKRAEQKRHAAGVRKRKHRKKRSGKQAAMMAELVAAGEEGKGAGQAAERP